MELESITRLIGDDLVLDAVDLVVGEGELLVLIGCSGAGKTSLLRAIAGLDRLSGGRVLMDGVDVTATPTRERDVAMVFQSNALFPNRTARANVAFPLRVRKMAEQEVTDRVTAEGRAMDIEAILDRWPDQLSEGHQRLVQIARAMVRVPRLFLLDEPLEGLDAPTRIRLRRELKTLQSGYGVAMIVATTDPEDARAMADRVAVLAEGRVLQEGTPRELWTDPGSRAVAEMLGPMGTIEVTVEPDARGYWLSAAGLRLRAWAPAVGALSGRTATLGVRPDAIRIDHDGPVSATLGKMGFSAGEVGREVLIGGSRLVSQVGADLAEGSTVSISFERWHLFDASGARVCTVDRHR